MSDSYEMERWADDRLLREANAGNTRAFAMFCVRSLPSLRRYVQYQLHEQGVARDLVDDFCHDAIIKAVDYISGCSEHGDRPLPTVSVAWIKQIAFNAINDFRRKNTRVELTSEVIAEARPSINVDDIDEYEEILKFFQWLGANERDMLEMVLVEGMKIPEAGERINLKSAAAYKTYERGLASLRDLLVEHGQFIASWLESR